MNNIAQPNKTAEQFDNIKTLCKSLFSKKMSDYGASWRIMRPTSLTDQILIKARRIRSIEEKKENLVGESIEDEFIGIINYGVIALIQLNITPDDELTKDEALKLYDKYFDMTTGLMLKKNHDYDEVWREMRISSFTDIILTKIRRTKQIEDNEGVTVVSEGVDANYMDMINYAIFALIRLGYGEKQ